ncbi:UbiH/UbiF/VisC/COQ6 family ubiquinone biosynthesis hydroxylase [Franzmannia qiaohouensis]|uniref:UbiH/UbiF/VisC/COQ6 family ubiquinone biosynthesis hydroxylase n=1 Tax=Franzmannia qiaohouensis TaxID=1329370 RepID=A0ABU1HJR8_9GAMM|nr:UbiH/UbiF/VisC/COQ6 family ubiquinone biosynthesis hydroxylase [Halomonas qiaohouensis]MDR5907727.1 UbiH/UbiF/VisC/COQ6 family ubiquinone biosynthesis hydroxylase [Halomonas qiaohouensis]
MANSAQVIIVGGGMVGAALAASLGQAGLGVALIESGAAPTLPQDDGFDLRVSSLNLAAERLLAEVGAWERIPQDRRCPFRRIHGWSQQGRGEARFDATSLGHDAFGSFVENRWIRAALWARLDELPTVTCYCGVRPMVLRQAANQVELELDDGTRLSGSLVVGADGARSALRELSGITVESGDYDQRALVINVATRLPQQDVSWQCFTPEGPQAMLPLPGAHASLVWYGKPDTITALEQLDPEALRQTLERDFPARLGGVEAVLGRASFPIRRQHARRYSDARCVLIGDAAHVISPLAGQGLNLGLQDVIALSERLVAAHRRGQDLGSAPLLDAYARQRRPQTLAMIAATELLHRVFTGAPPLRRLGSLGLAVTQRLPLAKRLMMRQAMGL